MKLRTTLSILILAVAAVAADNIDLSDVNPAPPTGGRVEHREVDFENNRFLISVVYNAGSEPRSMVVEVKASEIIAAASNPQMQNCLIELRTVLNTLTKVKVKSTLE